MVNNVKGGGLKKESLTEEQKANSTTFAELLEMVALIHPDLQLAPVTTRRTVEYLGKVQHTAKPHGLGIGLWLVYSYVDLLGGRIGVETAMGKGTTFTIGLPAL